MSPSTRTPCLEISYWQATVLRHRLQACILCNGPILSPTFYSRPPYSSRTGGGVSEGVLPRTCLEGLRGTLVARQAMSLASNWPVSFWTSGFGLLDRRGLVANYIRRWIDFCETCTDYCLCQRSEGMEYPKQHVSVVRRPRV